MTFEVIDVRSLAFSLGSLQKFRLTSAGAKCSGTIPVGCCLEFEAKFQK